MKKKFLYLILALLFIISGVYLVGCNFGDTSNNTDYNADVEEVNPENITIDDFIIEEGKTYYTSESLSLMMEVNGAFLEMSYFSLDGNKRVYDNLYFYVDDYFYMITGDYRDIYASLGDSTDTEYAEE